MSLRALAVTVAVLVACVAPAVAQAQGLAEWSEPTNPESSERFAFELRFGPYTPNTGDAASAATFGGSSLLIAAEFDVVPFRIADVLTLGIGAGIGFTSYSGKTVTGVPPVATDEETSLTLVPMSLVAVLRVVALSRLLSIPFILTGKLGADFVYSSASSGTVQDDEGISPGLRWAAQVALELDFFEPRAARALDDEWGINHSFLFFELYGSTAGGVGTPLAWAFGLGFNF